MSKPHPRVVHYAYHQFISTPTNEQPDGAWAAAPLAELIDELNEWYGDAFTLATRALAGRPEATTARLAGLDSAGVVVTSSAADGAATQRIDFAEPIATPDEVYGPLLDLLGRARAALPDAPLTGVERGLAEHARIRTFLTEVVAVDDVHPHLRRITFGGGDLDEFAPLGPDTFVYVLVPPAGRAELTIGRDFSWEAVGAMPEADRPGGAYYTVRQWDAATHRLEALFVLHGDEGSGSAWAMRAAPGDPVALWGPREAFEPPPGTDWYLLVADETGLPAVAAILEQLPSGTPARVFAEVADTGSRQELPQRPGDEVVWLYRDGTGAQPGTLLVEAVRALPWPGGTPYAWGGAESRAVTAVRKYLRNEVGLDREAVSMTGYWRGQGG
ncbi:MAG TPA: SIP domain-containing protein [Ilumatobacter sp.]|nr:SIP domain-containing protein [Ilumatobacter sp.]